MVKKMTDEEVNNLARRQAEGTIVQLKKGVEKSIKLNPAALPHLDRTLRALGLHIEQGGDSKDEDVKGSGETVPSRGAAAAKAKAKARAKASSEMDPEMKELGVRNYKICRMSAHTLKRRALEPTSPMTFSVPNLNHFLRKLDAVSSKEVCLQLVEFQTGQKRDLSIEGDLRGPDKFSDRCVTEAIKRGRRADGMVLPPCWPRDGIFQILRYLAAFINV